MTQMKLLNIVLRQAKPEPWSEGDNIPWHEPEFSRRMLKEHLSQKHDLASRRFETIDRHVDWIHHDLLAEKPTRILDLGCGPGLYTSRLARLGHECVGIDFSPAAVAYATDQAQAEALRCTYIQQDLRSAAYGEGFGLVMLIFGEFNVFSPTEVAAILQKAHGALVAGGLLLLEPHTFSAVQKTGKQPPSWFTSPGGLFSDMPHLVLMECFWDAETQTATERYFIIDAVTAQVTRYAQTFQAYTDEWYRSLLSDHDFGDVRFYPSLTGSPDESRHGLIAITGRKPDETQRDDPVQGQWPDRRTATSLR